MLFEYPQASTMVAIFPSVCGYGAALVASTRPKPNKFFACVKNALRYCWKDFLEI